MHIFLYNVMYWQIVHFLENVALDCNRFCLGNKNMFDPVVALALLYKEREVDAFETKCHSDPPLSSILYAVI